MAKGFEMSFRRLSDLDSLYVALQIFYLFLGLLLSGIATAEGLVPIQFK